MIFCFVIFFAFRIPCSDVRCRFHMEAMFGSSLPPVVYGRALCLVCVCLRIVLCCVFVFVFPLLVCHMVPLSLDCSFLVTPSLFYAVCLCFGAIAN